MVIAKNPFVWHPSADTVTTPVISMKVKDSNMSVVQVKDLQEPIRIQISNKGLIIPLLTFILISVRSSVHSFHPRLLII